MCQLYIGATFISVEQVIDIGEGLQRGPVDTELELFQSRFIAVQLIGSRCRKERERHTHTLTAHPSAHRQVRNQAGFGRAVSATFHWASSYFLCSVKEAHWKMMGTSLFTLRGSVIYRQWRTSNSIYNFHSNMHFCPISPWLCHYWLDVTFQQTGRNL